MWPGMMPILAMPGEITPGQLGPIRRLVLPCAAPAFMNALTFSMSLTGMPSVMQTISSMPASAASMMASAANGGGTKIIVALHAGLLARLDFHRIEDRDATRPPGRPCRG